MKNLIFKSVLVVFAAVLASCGGSQKSNGFELKGTLSNSSGETLILEQMSKGKAIFIDSAVVDEKGNFEFMNIKPTEMDFFRLRTSEANFAIIVADSTQKINFTGDAKNLGVNYSVEGSPDTKQFIDINKDMLSVSKQLDSLQGIMNAKMMATKMDSVMMMKINDEAKVQFDAIFAQTSGVLIKKVEAFPGTIANFSAFNVIHIDQHMDIYEKVLKALQEKHPTSFYTKDLQASLDQYKQELKSAKEQNEFLPDGSVMPDIKLKNPEGKEIALSSLKGKLVLVDFWASWCGPCREENPNVVKLYNEYHKKGFDIYSVSLDSDESRWVNAIKKDGLTWTHVSDLGGWSSSVCSQFNIRSIPFTILVGKDGKIVAKGLRGPALETKVAELLVK